MAIVKTAEGVKSMPVGLQIRKAREALSWDVEQIKNLLKISSEKIKIIETDNYPDKYIDVYFRGYIRTICRHLKLDSKLIFDDLVQRGYAINSSSIKENREFTRHSSFQLSLKPIMISFVCVLLALLSYGVFHNKPHENKNLNLNLFTKLNLGEKLSLQDIATNKVFIEPHDKHKAG